MTSVLQRLLDGRLHPRDRRVKYDAEYEAVGEKLDVEVTHIESLLSDEDKRRFNTLLDLHTGLNSISIEEIELSMFRLGALLMIEIYAGRNDLLREN